MRRILFLVLMFSSVGVMATPYTWKVNHYGVIGEGATPQTACEQFISKQSSRYLHSVEVNGTQFVCWFDTANPPTAYFAAQGYRSGDSCPNPETQTYNPQTGECESDDPCGDKLGQEFNFSISGVGSTDYMFISESGQFSAPSQTGCFNGCSASTVDQSCQVRSLGPWRCGGVAVYTGSECGEGETTVENSESLEKPSSETVTNKQDCNYITGPDGSQTCTSVSELEKKGQVCGTFNGETICPDIQPELDRTQVDTTFTTEDNGDGTTTTTKTDTATVTQCTGASCNTSTTTNTTVTNGGSTTSTCTGAQCPSSGNPDGDGDGFGDCVGECDGGVGPLGLEGQGEGTSFGDTLTDYQNRITNSPIASAVSSISMPSNGSCSFPTASTYLFDVDLNFICQNADWLDPLRFVFLAIWGFAAVRVLMSA